MQITMIKKQLALILSITLISWPPVVAQATWSNSPTWADFVVKLFESASEDIEKPQNKIDRHAVLAGGSLAISFGLAATALFVHKFCGGHDRGTYYYDKKSDTWHCVSENRELVAYFAACSIIALGASAWHSALACKAWLSLPKLPTEDKIQLSPESQTPDTPITDAPEEAKHLS